MTNKQQTKKNVSRALRQLMAEQNKSQADILHAIRGDEPVTAVRQRIYRYVHALTDTILGDDVANMAEFFDTTADFILNGGRPKKSRRAG